MWCFEILSQKWLYAITIFLEGGTNSDQINEMINTA